MRYISFVIMLLILPGCREMTQRQAIAPEIKRQDMQTLVEEPEEPVQKPYKRKTRAQRPKEVVPKSMQQSVSVTITESQPLKETLIELARQLKVDLQLDPKIDAHVVYTAHNKPFIEIIRHICRMSGLRYVLDHNSISIMPDTPYAKNYNMQFLNMARDSQNRVSISTDVFANVNSSGRKTNNDNGSNSEVKVSGLSDFWGELESNLKIILGESNTNYSIHRQGGLISISANKAQHDLVEEYFDKLREITSRQVLIEAKIVEVSLLDTFRSGINWQKVTAKNDLRFTGLMGDKSTQSRFLDTTTAQSDMFSLGGAGKHFSAILKALEQFGHSRTLSSPRLTVMNNQTAVLKVAQNQVYFRLNYDKQYNPNYSQNNTSISSDIQTVPIGLVMSVQPSIDQETGEVILFLRPTISKMAQSISDPAVDIAYNANVSSSSNAVAAKPSLVPVVEVKEIDSILRVQSGEIAILGGLMEVRSMKDDSGLPGFVSAPILRDLFGGQTTTDEVIELVILLKATIVEQSADPHPADNRLLERYTPDPRPL